MDSVTQTAQPVGNLQPSAISPSTLPPQSVSGPATDSVPAPKVVVTEAAAENSTPVTQQVSYSSSNEGSGKVAERSAQNAPQRIVLLEFTSSRCSYCQTLAPLIQKFREKSYPIQPVFLEKDAPLFQQYKIETTPSFVMLLDGQEVDRYVCQGEKENILRPQLLRMFQQTLDRCTASSATPDAAKEQEQVSPRSFSTNIDVQNLSDVPSPPQTSTIQGTVSPLPQSPTIVRGQSEQMTKNRKDETNSQSKQNASTQEFSLPPSLTSQATVLPNSAQVPATISPASPTGANSSFSFPSPALLQPEAATVRIRVSSETGNDRGTGTIIHVNKTDTFQEALVLTCGHLFRDTQGRGQIDVELFPDATAPPITVRGQCVYYDADIDIGFIGIPLPYDVATIPLVPQEYLAQQGDSVISVGCSFGDSPTILNHQILSTDQKFFQPSQPDSNVAPFYFLEVSNAPVQGRSGGGLFVKSPHGYYLLGVCNAGSPEDNNGYFLPASMIYATLLRHQNLHLVYNDMIKNSPQFSTQAPILVSNASQEQPRPQNAALDSASTNPVPHSQEASSAEWTQKTDPNTRIRPVNFENVQNESAPVSQESFPQAFDFTNSSQNSGTTASNPDSHQLTDAAFEEIRRRQQEGAEIICIVNWPGVPNQAAKETEVIRLPKQE